MCSPFFWDRFPVSGACTSTRQQDHDSYFNDVECRGVLLATLGHDLGCPEADGVQFTDLQGAFVRAQQRHGSDKENTGLESTWPLGERRQDFFWSVISRSSYWMRSVLGGRAKGSAWRGRLLEKFQEPRLQLVQHRIPRLCTPAAAVMVTK